MKIKGVHQLKRKLKKMPEAAKQEIRKALEKSAAEIVDLMRRMVPVDSGDLRDSIGWTWGAPPKAAVVMGTVGDAGLVITIYAGSDAAYYARMVEFGTMKMAPHPYFRPGFRLGKKRAKSRISRATNTAAKKVAAGR